MCSDDPNAPKIQYEFVSQQMFNDVLAYSDVESQLRLKLDVR